MIFFAFRILPSALPLRAFVELRQHKFVVAQRLSGGEATDL